MIGIIDYGMGNLRSVYNAFLSIDAPVKLVSHPSEFDGLSHLVIPGVGAFSQAMLNLHSQGLVNPIQDFIKTGNPVLGICLGMQLLATNGYEPSKTEGLNIIQGEVIKFGVINQRIPHVGWNSIELTQTHYLFEGVKKIVDFYFVHSYFFNAKNNDNILAYCNYGMNFPAVVHRNNVVGIQFHPEKSQKNGLKILENFSFNNLNA